MCIQVLEILENVTCTKSIQLYQADAPKLIEKVTYEQCQANDSGERATNFECVFYEALHNLYNLVNI